MKKSVCFLLTLILCGSVFALGGCAPRGEVLKIYNWGEYMDPEVYEGFEEWYFEQTKEKVTVLYKEFETNETMMSKIAVNKADYDLVCPSDYMAQRMIDEGLAQKIDTSIFDVRQEDLFYDGLMELVAEFDGDNEYFVPYVWGTFGIMYDASKVSASEAAETDSWSALWSSTFQNEIFMKDSVRDAYTVGLLYSRREALSAASDGFTDYGEAYKAELSKIFAAATEESILEAQEALIAQKKALFRYEVDDGKDDMLAANTPAKLGLFWSCDSGYVMNDVEVAAQGCIGDHTIPGNKNLFYVVPKEGSNVWVDGWIIPKYAKNVKAANWFLRYISEQSVAKQNMDWMGTSVAVKGAMEEAKAELEADEDGFFEDTLDGFKEMYLDMMFPSEEVLSRCGLMGDFGSKMNARLNEMWVDVRTA